MIRSIRRFFRSLLGMDDSIDDILEPLNKIHRRLARHAELQENKSFHEEEYAKEMERRAQARRMDAERARRRCEKTSELFAD